MHLAVSSHGAFPDCQDFPILPGQIDLWRPGLLEIGFGGANPVPNVRISGISRWDSGRPPAVRRRLAVTGRAAHAAGGECMQDVSWRLFQAESWTGGASGGLGVRMVRDRSPVGACRPCSRSFQSLAPAGRRRATLASAAISAAAARTPASSGLLFFRLY